MQLVYRCPQDEAVLLIAGWSLARNGGEAHHLLRSRRLLPETWLRRALRYRVRAH